MGTEWDREEKGLELVLPDGDAASLGFPGHLTNPCLPVGRILGRAGGPYLSHGYSWVGQRFTTILWVPLQNQRVLSWKEQCSNLCLQCTCTGVLGQGAFPALPPTHHGAYSPGCPSHPRSSLPSAAAAVPGNLSLKSINFSHTPRERCKSPSLLPPWLLSATIWHRPPRPPTPALPLIPARQPELYDLSRESPRTKPWAALRPRWFF